MVNLRSLGAVVTAPVAAVLAHARALGKSGVAPVTTPPKPHARNLVDQRLASGPARARHHDGFPEAVMGYYGLQLLLHLDRRLALFPPLSARLLLRVGALGRVPAAFRAVMVAAARACAAEPERRVAPVAVLVDTNADGLLCPVDLAFRRVPARWFNVHAIVLPKFPGAFFVVLSPRHCGRALVVGECLRNLLSREIGAISDQSARCPSKKIDGRAVATYLSSSGSSISASVPASGCCDCCGCGTPESLFADVLVAGEEEDGLPSPDFLKIVLIRVSSPFLSLPSFPGVSPVRFELILAFSRLLILPS